MSNPGQTVRALRIAAGMSQAQLARKVDISQSAISQIEQGHTHGMSGLVLFRFCKALSTTPEMIYEGPETAKGLESTMAERELLGAYRDLPTDSRRALLATARGLMLESGKASKSNPFPRSMPPK